MNASCCAHHVPGYSGDRREGDKWTCPECGSEWAWIEDEAEGGFFTPNVVSP